MPTELGEADDDPEEDEPETNNLVLAQFDKVSHVKTKWKVLLRGGVATVDGREYVFKEGTGNFTF